MIFEVLNILITVIAQFFIAMIKLVPTVLELKNLPIDIISVSFGVSTIIISLEFMVIKNIKNIKLI